MMDAIYRAVNSFYQSPDEWNQIIMNNLQKRSWGTISQEILDLYHLVVKNKENLKWSKNLISRRNFIKESVW